MSFSRTQSSQLAKNWVLGHRMSFICFLAPREMHMSKRILMTCQFKKYIVSCSRRCNRYCLYSKKRVAGSYFSLELTVKVGRAIS